MNNIKIGIRLSVAFDFMALLVIIMLLIGIAVTETDSTTQQNASLVEESASAAASLKDQAERLLQAVSVFSLGNQVITPSVNAASEPVRQKFSTPGTGTGVTNKDEG
ncbi:hypothetical protein [Pantoea ananatis]|uniref:hypothetical protein n=1 Tax=Pantoea ananas TaxID=553 RepID=UPI001B30388C